MTTCELALWSAWTMGLAAAIYVTLTPILPTDNPTRWLFQQDAAEAVLALATFVVASLWLPIQIACAWLIVFGFILKPCLILTCRTEAGSPRQAPGKGAG